jgi:PPM family protein phosphatase
VIEVFTHSKPGGHAENEDAFIVRSAPFDEECRLVALADGQGGRAGGGLASLLACEAAIRAALGYSLPDLLHPKTWPTILRMADRVVAEDLVAGFTTLIAFCVTNEQVCGASSGDSAVVLSSADRPQVVLTARQHKNPPVGSGNATFVNYNAALTQPWMVLGISDGVWKYAGWENVLQTTAGKRGEEVVRSLRNHAQMRNGGLQDDFTAVVLEGRND